MARLFSEQTSVVPGSGLASIHTTVCQGNGPREAITLPHWNCQKTNVFGQNLLRAWAIWEGGEGFSRRSMRPPANRNKAFVLKQLASQKKRKGHSNTGHRWRCGSWSLGGEWVFRGPLEAEGPGQLRSGQGTERDSSRAYCHVSLPRASPFAPPLCSGVINM